MVKSILISTFMLLCATIIETSILSNIAFLYIVPDLVLICSVYFSLLNGKTVGESTGFISGLFLDAITGVPFGFNCLYRTIIGYVYGIFSGIILYSGIIMPMFCVGIATVAKHIFIFLINLLYPNVHIYAAGLISKDFLFEFIANIILAPLMFKFLSIFKKSLAIKTIKDKVDNV